MHFSVRSIPSITKDSGAGKDACTISMGWRITPTYQTRQAAPRVRQNRFKCSATTAVARWPCRDPLQIKPTGRIILQATPKRL
jgi:hypothetical protein